MTLARCPPENNGRACRWNGSGVGAGGGESEGWRGDGGALVSDRFRSNILTITSLLIKERDCAPLGANIHNI